MDSSEIVFMYRQRRAGQTRPVFLGAGSPCRRPDPRSARDRATQAHGAPVFRFKLRPAVHHVVDRNEIVGILREASRKVYDNVSQMAGTADAAGDYGIGAGGDVSRRIDIIAEKTVLDHLDSSGLPCVVLGEECGRVELSQNPEGYVIMDAIDGSANAVRGVPFFCSSLAFATEDSLSSVSAGVVTDLSSGDMYWAVSSDHGGGGGTDGSSSNNGSTGGAFLNDSRIHVRDTDPIYRIVGINTSGASASLMERLQPLFEDNNHIRHFGANALEMALFARGTLDAFVDIRDTIRIQDIAAGYLIAKEAGGLLTNQRLEPLDADLEYGTRISFIMATDKDMLEYVASRIRPPA